LAAIIRNFGSLLLGTFLLLAGMAGVGSIVPYRLGLAETPTVAIGIVSAAYFVGIVAGTFYAQRLIGAVGHIRAFAALASIASGVALVHALAFGIVSWGILRFVAGFCMAGLFMCLESWLNDRATNRTRGAALSSYMIATSMGTSIGQLALPIPDGSGFAVFVIASVLMSLAVVPVAVTRIEAPVIPQPQRFSFVRLYRQSPLAVIGTVASGLLVGAFHGIAPLYCIAMGLDAGSVALVMGGVVAGGMLVQGPIGFISDRLDRRVVLLAVVALVPVAAVLLHIAISLSPLALAVAAFLLGGALFTIYPLGVALANDRTDPKDFVPVSGGLITSFAFGAVIGPLGVSTIMSSAGPLGFVSYMACTSILLLIFGLWRLQQRDGLSVEDQGAYQVTPLTTPIASELDPRGEDLENQPIPLNGDTTTAKEA
jgi:MFS family permease